MMSRRLALPAALLAVLTCTDAVEPPVAGWADVRLASPDPTWNDGGILFTLAGGSIDSIRTAYPWLFTDHGEDRWQVIVAGDLIAGVIAQVWVPDLRRLDAYRASIQQVTVRWTHRQRPLSGYSVTVTAPGDGAS